MTNLAVPSNITVQNFKVYKDGKYIGQCRYIKKDAAWRFVPIDTTKPVGPKGMTWLACIQYLREPTN